MKTERIILQEQEINVDSKIKYWTNTGLMGDCENERNLSLALETTKNLLLDEKEMFNNYDVISTIAFPTICRIFREIKTDLSLTKINGYVFMIMYSFSKYINDNIDKCDELELVEQFTSIYKNEIK